jgi:hypothetical protein
MRPNVLAFGSHPDLSVPEYHDYFGNVKPMPSYMPYQNGQKMYSSLTKIPMKNPEKSLDKPVRKIKIRKRPDSQKSLPIPNSNYLRPLTPHLPMGGISNHDIYEDQGIPRKKHSSRRPMRPASSIDFSHADIERREAFANSFAKPESFNQEDSYQRGRNEFSTDNRERQESHQEKLFRQSLLNSPRGHPGEGRARNDLHMSLQKLLVERQRADLDKQRQDNYEDDYHPYANDPPFRPLASSSIEEKRVVSEPPELPPKNVEQVQIEDYGIFGDDDGEDEDDYEYDDDYRDRKPVLEDQNISRIQGKEEISNASSPEPVTFESESTSESRSKTYQVDSDHEDQSQTESVSHDQTLNGSSSFDQSINGRNEESDKITNEEKSVKRDRKMRPENLVPLKPERRKSSPSGNSSEEFRNENVESSNERRHPLVQGQKPQEETKKPERQLDNSEKNKLPLSVFSEDSEKKTKPLSLKARQMETLNISPSKEAMFSSSQIRSREGIGRKLPQVNGRFSVPVFDSSYKSKAPTPQQSPTDNKPPRAGGSKDTKIPVYSPLKKKGDKSSEPLSRSTEDVSKLKKKTHFKDSIKSFFGRKRYEYVLITFEIACGTTVMLYTLGVTPF